MGNRRRHRRHRRHRQDYDSRVHKISACERGNQNMARGKNATANLMKFRCVVL